MTGWAGDLILGSSNMRLISTQILRGEGRPSWKGRLEPDNGKELVVHLSWHDMWADSLKHIDNDKEWKAST